MKNKILLSAAILAATSSTIFAAVEPLTATVFPFAEPTIAEQTQLDFGNISPASGISCTMDVSGAITSGSCSGTTAVGDVKVTGLAAGTSYQLTVTGNGTGNILDFVPSATATDSSANASLSDGTGESFSSDGSDLDILVFGTITVGATDLVAGVAATAAYTVDVSCEKVTTLISKIKSVGTLTLSYQYI